MTGRRRFYLLVGLQAVFLAAWAGYHEVALRGAPTVLLETRPVDPSEILRGDFITLNYAISTIPRALVSPPPVPGSAHFGEAICVTVAPRGEFWEVVAASLGRCACETRPADARYQIQGTVTPAAWSADADLRVDYGIGRYYVPEGKGTPRGRITARVAVSHSCQALLKEIYLDGRRYP
ncbi:MAG TPA: GDYXXLXY domain-containing protein [Candidatus Polarisedimenticolia bacterium]|nr:GDYXXLXY domain-containing protein [Candidatus Polarisedimenticolia bacterium]